MMPQTDPENPNRTMEQEDLLHGSMRTCLRHLVEIGLKLLDSGGKFCSWVGTLDDAHRRTTELNKGSGYKPLPKDVWPWDLDIPWFTVWEYCWVLSNFRQWAGNRKLWVLSLGGNACLLDLALMRDGHHVTLVEQRSFAVNQQVHNAKLLGAARSLSHRTGRIEEILPEEWIQHDAMTSTNVLHLAGSVAQQAVGQELKRLIKPQGRAFFTFDYLNPNPARYVEDPAAHFKWSGFQAWPSGSVFLDTGSRRHLYYPEPEKGCYTAGALIQEHT